MRIPLSLLDVKSPDIRRCADRVALGCIMQVTLFKAAPSKVSVPLQLPTRLRDRGGSMALF